MKYYFPTSNPLSIIVYKCFTKSLLEIPFFHEIFAHCISHKQVCISISTKVLFETASQFHQWVIFPESKSKNAVSEVMPVDDDFASAHATNEPY